MIQINDKKDCCGCYGCFNVCPKQCIYMKSDSEGFAYPVVDKSSCIECGLCEKVCPVINRSAKRDLTQTEVVACKSRNELERLASSSGGVFSLLATQTIKNSGIVFAAAFDKNFEVRHSGFDSLEQLPLYRGSKYIPSKIGDSYAKAKTELTNGRQVMFVGTHCQIAGLQHFLRKEYDNLLTVEIICHGVPSPVVFGKFLHEVAPGEIQNISFRDKSIGWARYSMKIDYIENGAQKTYTQPAYQNPYMRGFIKGLYLRPSCYSCPAKDFVSGADITLADYWGVDTLKTDINDDKGVSMVLTYNTKGKSALQSIADKLEIHPSTLDSALKNNPAIYKSVNPNPLREKFFAMLTDHSFSDTIARFVKPVKSSTSLFTRVKWKLMPIKDRLTK